ncbi:E3 ubiquitin-protein ligase bre1, partial [Mortierella sp. AD094]
MRQIERRIDREKSALGSTMSSSQSIANIANITAATLNDMSEASRDELLQFRRLAISRLAEIEETNLQKTQMKDDLDKLRAQLDQLSDEKVQDSQYVRALLVQMQSARHDGEFYRGEVLRLRSDLEDLHTSRRRFVDTLETEEKNRRATLEAELKKLESDISRVKDSRDRFQQMYENRCSKDDYEMQQNQEIRKIANTRKDRITTLSTEISRLQTMLAATSDDWDSYAFYLKNPGDKATLKDLRSKLGESEELINTLHIELESTKEAVLQARDLVAVRSSESQLKEQVDALSGKLAHLDSLMGPGADDKIKALVAGIEAKDAAIKRLELKVQAHEAVQTPLLNELHTVANAWGQLEEATSRKAIDLAQKEDLIFKLLSDKTRQESKCNNLIRAKDQSANMMAVMKRQSDMQLDQISRLEEREKSLNQQMFKISPSRDSSVAASMDDRGNRKRRLTEDSGQHGQVVTSAAANGSPAPFTPPSNKRQFTGSGSSSPLGNTKEDTENMTAAEGVLLNFQKEAIWRQMQEYKREIARAQERIEQLEDKQADYDSQISSVDTYWSKLLEELRTLVSRSRISVQKDDMFLRDGSSFASLLSQGPDLQQEDQDIRELTENATKPTVEASCERTKEIVLKLLRIIEAWTTQRGSFWTGYCESDTTTQGSSVIQQL